jgi:hypothetical protein
MSLKRLGVWPFIAAFLILAGWVDRADATAYYFAASGSISNSGTDPTHPWPIDNISKSTFNGGDILLINSGDTFTTCLWLAGGVNMLSTRTSKIRISHYGTGALPKIIPNCTAANGKIGAINIRSVDGLIIDGIEIQGDSAGQAARCISITNADSTAPHGTLVIERSVFHGCHNGIDNHFGGHIFIDASANNGSQYIDHITLLNNIMYGDAGNTDDGGINSYGYGESIQYDAIQGNLVYNINGNPNMAYGDANGILISGAGTNKGAYPWGARVQYNVVHNDGANMNVCGDFYSIWTYNSDSVVIAQNESANNQPQGGCDGGAWDADNGSTNVNIYRNYSNNDWGPCITLHNGAPWGPNSAIENVCIDSGWGGVGMATWPRGDAGQVGHMDRNWIQQKIATNWVFSVAGGGASDGASCAGAGSTFSGNQVIANNLVGTQNDEVHFVSLQVDYQNTPCTAPAMSNNNYWTNDPSRRGRWRNGGNVVHDLASWQAIAPGGDKGSTFAPPPTIESFIPVLSIALSPSEQATLDRALNYVSTSIGDPYIQGRLSAVRRIVDGPGIIADPRVEGIVGFVLSQHSDDAAVCTLLHRLSAALGARFGLTDAAVCIQ